MPFRVKQKGRERGGGNLKEPIDVNHGEDDEENWPYHQTSDHKDAQCIHGS
jgi:hypothetical protein